MNREINIRLNANRAKAVHTGHKFASGDKGIVFRIAVDELDTTGTTAKIVFKRSNGTSVEAGLTGKDGIYSYTTLGNEFAVVGPVTADVKFYEKENRVSTCTFVFDVTSDTLDGLGNGTAGYSDTLERMKKSMEQAEADILAAKDELEKRAEEILQQMKETAESAEEDVETAEQKMVDLSADLEALYQEYVDAFGSTGPFNPRGPYSETETYTVRDMVYHNDASWVCYRNCTGVAPSKNSDCWQYLTVGAEVNLDDIISGEKQVGDAKKLDGHAAEYFAALDMVQSKNIFDSSVLRQGDYNDTSHTIRVSQNVEDRPYVKEGETYTISCQNSELQMAVLVSDEDNNIIQNFRGMAPGTFTFTIQKNGYLGTVFSFDYYDGKWEAIAVNDVVNAKVQIERGSEATEYEEFFKNNRELTEDCATKKDLANYFKNTGGTVENATFGEALRVKRTSAYDSVTTYENSEEVLGYIGMSNTKKPIYTDETKANTYELLHTGNKPNGSYTGNGSATERRIATNGIGDGAIVYSSNGIAIVTRSGSTIIPSSGNTFFTTAVAFSLSGEIVVNTDNAVVNTSGVTYKYLTI